MDSEETSEETAVLCNIKSLFNGQSDGSSVILVLLCIGITALIISIVLTENIIKIKIKEKTRTTIIDIFSKIFLMCFLFLCVLIFLKIIEMISPQNGVKVPEIIQLIILLFILSFFNIFVLVVAKKLFRKKPLNPNKASNKLYFIPIFYICILVFLLCNQCMNYHINFLKLTLHDNIPPLIPKLFNSSYIQKILRNFMKGLFKLLGNIFLYIRIPQSVFKEFIGCTLFEIVLVTIFIVIINHNIKNKGYIGWIFNIDSSNIKTKNDKCLIDKSMVENFVNDLWVWSLIMKIILIIVLYNIRPTGGSSE